MKKLLVGIIAAFMMAASLVAATGTSASAKNCGYNGCLPTDTQVKIKNKRGCKIQVKAGVSAGNVVVNRGRIKIQVKGNGLYRQKIRQRTERDRQLQVASRRLPRAGEVHPGRQPFQPQR